MNKLVGSGNVGNFVLNNQTLATNQGFKNVSKLWYDKCIKIEDGIDKIQKERQQQEDVLTSISNVTFFAEDTTIKVKVKDKVFVPTEKALSDMARWCDQVSIAFVNRITSPAIAPNGKVLYKRDAQDTETLALVLNNGKRRIEKDKKFLFRTYNDGTLRCMLSDRYAIIDNIWYLKIIQEVIPGGMLSHWRGNADTIYGNVLIPDSIRQEFDSDYGAMLSLSNCEIGLRRLSQFPSLFRAICMNGNIWDRTTGKVLNQVHRGEINLLELKQYIVDNLNKQIPLAESLISKFMDCRKMEVTKQDVISNVFTTILQDAKLQKKEARQVIDEFKSFESGERNLFGIINAITRAGQKFENDRWVELDFLGGKLMQFKQNDWDRVLAKSKTVTAKDYEAVFGA